MYRLIWGPGFPRGSLVLVVDLLEKRDNIGLDLSLFWAFRVFVMIDVCRKLHYS